MRALDKHPAGTPRSRDRYGPGLGVFASVIVASLAALACCPAPRPVAPADPAPEAVPATRSSAAPSGDVGEALLHVIERRFERGLGFWTAENPDPTALGLIADAKALGVTTPPSETAWRQLVEASRRASPNVQLYLLLSSYSFGDRFSDAAYRAYSPAARDVLLRVGCVAYEAKRWRAERATAESMLRLAKELLEAPKPEHPSEREVRVESWMSLEIRALWSVPYEADRGQAEMLNWVNRALSRREQWQYSEEAQKWVE